MDNVVDAIDTPTRNWSIVEGLGHVMDFPVGGRALDTEGSLWAWGENEVGQLGDGTTTNRYMPVRVMNNVARIVSPTSVICDQGSLWAWGTGFIGDGRPHDAIRNRPVRIINDVAEVFADGVLTNSGHLYLWGTGFIGDGQRDTVHRNSPVRIMSNVAERVSRNAVITTNGDLYQWGLPYEVRPRQLEGWHFGDGAAHHNARLRPVRIMQNVAEWINETTVITNDRSLWAWGSGIIGDGRARNVNRTSPVRIMQNVEHIEFIGERRIVITTAGDLYEWGGANTERLTPHRLMRGANGARIFGSVEMSTTRNATALRFAVLLPNGELYMWGRNYANMFGDNNPATLRDNPVLIMRDVKDFSMNHDYAQVVKNDGTAWVWSRWNEMPSTPTRINFSAMFAENTR